MAVSMLGMLEVAKYVNVLLLTFIVSISSFYLDYSIDDEILF